MTGTERPHLPRVPHKQVNPALYLEEFLTVPTDHLPDAGMPGAAAYEIVRDEAMLDGNARLNLATFVTTWMDEHADKVYALAYDKNMIDKDEYPSTAEVEARCTRIMANLWHAPGETIGVSTVGSSEACMMGGLAFLKRWRAARKAAGKPVDSPNMVMSSAVQVVWERFCRYWDVEPRYADITLDAPVMTPDRMLALVDENTIGVVGILGVTYTGDYEPIEQLAAALDDLQKRTGLDVPLHVDAASGGMIAPFLQPDLVWDFRLSRVHSINTSGHKYGLVYPGLGWVVWRSKDLVPEEMIFDVSYLGGHMPTLGINFSRPGAQVLLQYYAFLRLGRAGYTTVQAVSQEVAKRLSSRIGEMPQFTLISDGSDTPVFAWRLSDDFTGEWTLHQLSQSLRYYGWQVPAYPMPASIEDVEVMRIVVRNGMGMDLAEKFLSELATTVAALDAGEVKIKGARGYAH